MTLAAPNRRSPARPPSPYRWTTARLRAELKAFLANEYLHPTAWPRAMEFESLGRSDLRQAIKRHGGATFWARELGREMDPRQERSPYLDADALADAQAVLAVVGAVPCDARLRQLGYNRLAGYFKRCGGRTAVLTAFGMPLAFPSRRSSEHDPHTLQDPSAVRERAALDQARELVARHGRLPGRRLLTQSGYSQLGYYLDRNGGAAAFCQRHGLPY